MNIEIITAWYNEEFLAPFFLRHYGDVADEITVLLDTKTDDFSPNYLAYCNIVKVDYGDNMSERTKRDSINQAYRNSKADYVIIADADEFIFFDPDIEYDFDVARVKLYNVYRHETDKNLDSGKPVREQRRHGEHIWPYVKPMILRTGLNLKLSVGNHSITYDGQRELYKGDTGRLKYYPKILDGAHWVYADPFFCVQRRMDRIKRLGSVHAGDETEESILNKCKEHRNDPVVL